MYVKKDRRKRFRLVLLFENLEGSRRVARFVGICVLGGRAEQLIPPPLRDGRNNRAANEWVAQLAWLFGRSSGTFVALMEMQIIAREASFTLASNKRSSLCSGSRLLSLFYFFPRAGEFGISHLIRCTQSVTVNS